MIDKILKATRGRPCSCPSGKICTACKKKKVIPPQVYVEEPRRLPASVTISYSKPSEKTYKQTATVQYVEKPSRWRLRKREKYEPEPKQSPFCKWYKRRRALKQLIAEHKKEQEELKRQRRWEYEQERMRELMKWGAEHEKYRTQSLSNESFKWKKVRSKSLPPPKKQKVVIKERSASVKPAAKSKYVASKKFTTKETISRRFVNYCYRLCCQFYCYLTCMLLVIFTVVCVL